jgi:hypothetical protein
VVNIGVHDSFIIIIIIIILIVPMNALFYLLLYYINGARASEPGSKEMGSSGHVGITSYQVCCL